MNPWVLVYEDFSPEHEGLREALCTLGNGYIATRGAAEESRADDRHYPGTYLAGGYNRLDSNIAGRTITNEDLVNFPNWLTLSFCPEDGDWFNLQAVDILDYRQELDMQRGILQRDCRVRDKHGRISRVHSRRLVHMDKPHIAAIEYELTAENWSGPVRVRSSLDGSIINSGVARYRELNSKHLNTLDLGQFNRDTIYLLVETLQSHLQMAQVARTRSYCDNKPIVTENVLHRQSETIAMDLKFEIETGKPVVIEKIVTLHASRDRAISECLLDARLSNDRCERFQELLQSHERAWKYLWHRCDVRLKKLDVQQQILRLHMFHLLQSVSPNTVGLDVGVPPRGLHGEAYRGHIFWDELFIFPFYTFRIPAITHSLLLYRYRRLDAARCYAQESGYAGAMYPWQSGSNGREETQLLHLNPHSGSWGPDFSRYQRHVNIAIAYNIWHYCQVTGDWDFLANYGAEMLLEIARFWSSIATCNEQTKRYVIQGVMGPDEYHEKYPNQDSPGINNNAYTNIMSVWVLERALQALDLLKSERREELLKKLEISQDELDHWQTLTRKMTVPFHDDEIISQFEGYEKLEELDWEGYSKKYGNIERLDRILKAEGDSPDRYKVSKQADVLMLFYLLTPRELRRIIGQLGYSFNEDAIGQNLEYYLRRTSHGSTLSQVVHASVLDRLDRTAAWSLFCEALQSDISDIQGGTTAEGIHLGAMAGTVDIVMRHYAGIDISGEIIGFYPRLPESLQGLHLRLCYRGQWFELDIDLHKFSLFLDADGDRPVQVNVQGKIEHLTPGSKTEYPLEQDSQPLATGDSAKDRSFRI